jgi:PAS domain S-box-containing protein
VIEDSEDDILLLLRELRKGGYEPDCECIETEAAMKSALHSREWDIIICDFNMPTFRGDHALSLLKESGLDVPFILLSGTIGERIAVDMMKAGANDYIMKKNMTRLVPAIQRELREAKHRQEKREAQAALQQSEEKYRTILHSMHDLVFVIDKHDCYSQYYTSSEELFYVSPKEFMGRHVSEVLLPSEAKRFVESFQRVRESGSSETFDYQLEIGGQKHWFSAVLSLQEDGESIVQVVRDITRRKKAEEDMKAAAETAMLYLDLMGHDIRNHLQAIIMGMEILEHKDFGPEARQMVDIVVNSVKNSQNLIKKVQATRGLLSVPLSSTPLRGALEDCLQVLNETYDDVQITAKWGPQHPIVLADKYLGNLLMNILENAVLHSDKKKKRVWLNLREMEGGYEVAIADNGPGILDERKASLFDQDRRFGGVGVHQALKIAQKYGGRISVQDRVRGDPSKGAEFHIWFPKLTP